MTWITAAHPESHAPDSLALEFDKPEFPQPESISATASLPSPNEQHHRPFWINALAAIVIIALLIFAAVQLFQFGLQVRADVWHATTSIRFSGDAAGGFETGGRLVRWAAEQVRLQTHHPVKGGPWNVTIPQLIQAEPSWYDQLLNEHDNGDYGMDYPPGRLMMMALWYRQINRNHMATHQPIVREWDDDVPDMARFVLDCNTAASAAAAVLMFFLVWHWMRRDARRAWASGTAPKPWWPMDGLLVAVAAGFGLSRGMWLCWQVGGVPDWWDYAALSLLLIALVIALRHLPAAHRAWSCAFLAAIMVWLDPASLAVSHVWPQWDIWAVPFFIAGALLASLDWQFTAAVTLALGSLFKGQLLILVPIFPLWLLFGGRLGALCRFIAGFAFCSAIVFSPWLVQGSISFPWIRWAMAGAMLAAGLSTLRLWIFRRENLMKLRVSAATTWHALRHIPHWRTWPASRAMLHAALAALIASALVLIPLMLLRPVARGDFPRALNLCIVLFVLALPWLLPRRAMLYWLAACVAGAIWISGVLLDGSFSWFWVGYEYGTRRQDRMQMGYRSFSNLPAILHQHYQWDLHDIIWNFPLPGGQSYLLETKSLLLGIYVVAMILCAIGAAIHSRRDDPRTLAALSAVALLFPCLIAQTSERYLVMASAVSCSLIAVSVGMTLLHVLVALMGCAMVMHQIITNTDNSQFAPRFTDFWSRTYPDIAWLMMMMAAIMLAQALIPGRRRRMIRAAAVEPPPETTAIAPDSSNMPDSSDMHDAPIAHAALGNA